jgi:hypothetical protein
MTRANVYLNDPIVRLITDEIVPEEFDITSQVSGVEVMASATVLERTTFGNSWKRRGRGLKTGSIKIDLYIDFDADGMFELWSRLFRDFEYVDFEVWSDESENHGVVGTFVMSQVPAFSGTVDEYNTASLTFETDGEVLFVGADS